MKKIIKILLKVIAFVVILFVLFIFRSSFASLFSKIIGISKTDIAEPIFVMENTNKKLLNDENTEVDYYFNIKNFTDNKRSQTDLKYIIEIQPKLDSAISLTLYKDNKIIKLDKQKTDYIEIKHDSNTTHSYRLNVKYEREKSNSTTDIKENVFIKASAIQS